MVAPFWDQDETQGEQIQLDLQLGAELTQPSRKLGAVIHAYYYLSRKSGDFLLPRPKLTDTEEFASWLKVDSVIVLGLGAYAGLPGISITIHPSGEGFLLIFL